MIPGCCEGNGLGVGTVGRGREASLGATTGVWARGEGEWNQSGRGGVEQPQDLPMDRTRDGRKLARAEPPRGDVRRIKSRVQGRIRASHPFGNHWHINSI